MKNLLGITIKFKHRFTRAKQPVEMRWGEPFLITLKNNENVNFAIQSGEQYEFVSVEAKC